MKSSKALVFALTFVSIPTAVALAQPTPIGDEFQITVQTPDDRVHFGSTLTVQPDDTFFMMWMSGVVDASYWPEEPEILLQRFESDGTVRSPRIVANAYGGGVREPGAAILPNGRVVSVWHNGAIQVRRFDVSGKPMAPEGLVHDDPGYSQTEPDIAVQSDGDVFVAWRQHTFPAYSEVLVMGRLFHADGTPAGPPIAVAPQAPRSTAGLATAAQPDDRLLVAWSQGPAASHTDDGFDLFVRRFDADGVALAAPTRVNLATADGQVTPRIAVQPDGAFVVIWTRERAKEGADVFLRRFAADGTALGGDVQVNIFTPGGQGRPDIAVDADGNFVVVWQDFRPPEPPAVADSRISLRAFLADGTPVGDIMRIDTATLDTDYNTGPQVAMAGNGEILVVWENRHWDPEIGRLQLRGRRLVGPIE